MASQTQARVRRAQKSLQFRDRLREYCAQLKVQPHEFMAQLIADESAPIELRLQAAKELAQYLEPKLKAVDHSGDVSHAVSIIEVTLG
jgi:hypothetical protein